MGQKHALSQKSFMMKVLFLLVACVSSAVAHVAMPAAGAPMLARVPRMSAASSIAMDHHVHRAMVAVGDNEPIEVAVKRFRREVSRSGHLPALRARKRFRSPAEVRQDILKKEARRLRFVPPHLR